MKFFKNIYFNALQICVTNQIDTADASMDASTVFNYSPSASPKELKAFLFEQEGHAGLCYIIAKDWDLVLDLLRSIFIFIEWECFEILKIHFFS